MKYTRFDYFLNSMLLLLLMLISIIIVSILIVLVDNDSIDFTRYKYQCESPDIAIYNTDYYARRRSDSFLDPFCEESVGAVKRPKNIDPSLKIAHSYQIIDLSTIEPLYSLNGLDENGLYMVNQLLRYMDAKQYHIYIDNEAYVQIFSKDDIDRNIRSQIGGFISYYIGDTRYWHAITYNALIEEQWDAHDLIKKIKYDDKIMFVPYDLLNLIKQKRYNYVRSAEKVLQDFNLYEMDEIMIINKICHYFTCISEKTDYSSMSCNTTENYWYFMNGSCNNTAMAFKQLLDRAGIQCDVIVGYTDSGGYHAWNRVELKDGSYRYYDMTLYKAGFDTKYIHIREPIHNEYCINAFIYYE